MNILSIAGVSIVAAVAALLIRRQNPQTALMLSVGAGAVILLSVIKNMILTAEEINRILTAGNIRSEDIVVVLKAIGIAMLTEFSCDTVTEAGMISLSTNLSFAGKLLILASSIPLIQEVISMITSLVTLS